MPKRKLILISTSLALLTLLAFKPVRYNGFGDFAILNIAEKPAVQKGLTQSSGLLRQGMPPTGIR
jgi:hypothetical protein